MIRRALILTLMWTPPLLAQPAWQCAAVPGNPPLSWDIESLEMGQDPCFPPPRTILLNRSGGRYFGPANAGDPDDSSNGISSLIDPGKKRVIPPFSGSDTDWSDLVACVRSEFSRWQVNIVEDRSSALDQGTFVEAVVGGLPSNLGARSDAGGDAQFTACGGPQCGATQLGIVNERAIVFIFSDTFNTPFPMPRQLCEAVAHEIGHAFTLDHKLYSPDTMSYQPFTPKHFQDEDSYCGEASMRHCLCFFATQVDTQDSLTQLDSAIGVQGGNAPIITFSTPSPRQSFAIGAVIPVRAQILGQGGVSQASLRWIGRSPDYPLSLLDPSANIWGADITVPPDAASGTAKLRILATDSQGRGAKSSKRKIRIQ
jgi:hypothetical protein